MTPAGRGKKAEMKMLTVRIPAEIHRKLKVLAAVTGKTITDLVVEWIDRTKVPGLPSTAGK